MWANQLKPTYLMNNILNRSGRLFSPLPSVPGSSCCILQQTNFSKQLSTRYLHQMIHQSQNNQMLSQGLQSGNLFSKSKPINCMINLQKTFHQPYRSLHVGQSIVVNASFSFNDVRQFAAITQDTNPIHLNEEYAAKSRFGRPVVHGVLVLGFVSGVLGTKMPGIGTIIINHEVSYPHPTFIGDTVTCMAKVVEINKGRRVLVHVSCSSLEEEKTVLEGDFNLLVTREILDKGENS